MALWSEIIHAAAASKLGLLALGMLILGAVVLGLFSKRDHWGIRLLVLSVMLLGAGLLSYATFQEVSESQPGGSECSGINSSVITPLSATGSAYWCRYTADLGPGLITSS